MSINLDDYLPKTIIYNHPDWKYHAAPGVSASQLKTFVNQSPCHYKYRYIDGNAHPYSSDSLLLGSLVHCMVLEPGAVNSRYQRENPDSLRTADDLKQWCRAHDLPATGKKPELIARIREHDSEVSIVGDPQGNKQVIKSDMWDTAWRMRDAVLANADARQLLAEGQPEVSVWAEHNDTGQLIKCRCDWLRPDRVAIDLKTCACAAPGVFSKDCAKFGYGLQEAHYREVLSAADQGVDEFVFIAVESQPPHLCQVYLLDEHSREVSRLQHAKALDQLHGCQTSGVWPNYCPDSSELSLPGWYLRQLENAS